MLLKSRITKSFRSGFSVNDHGEFTRWFNGKGSGIESPLEQNRRHIEVLRQAIQPILPTRMGLRLQPDFRSLVLLSADTTFKRPTGFDTSEIIKVDGLKTRVQKDLKGEGVVASGASLLRMVSVETLLDLGRRLVELHRPSSRGSTEVSTAMKAGMDQRVEPTFGATGLAVAPVATSDTKPTPSCRHCSGLDLRIEYGRNYYFKCETCEKNTRIDLSPGTKLRKQGSSFFLVTADGEFPFFTNLDGKAGAVPPRA